MLTHAHTVMSISTYVRVHTTIAVNNADDTFEYSLGFGDDNNYDNDTDQRSFEWFVMTLALCKIRLT